jgi:hypothetical protein
MINRKTPSPTHSPAPDRWQYNFFGTLTTNCLFFCAYVTASPSLDKSIFLSYQSVFIFQQALMWCRNRATINQSRPERRMIRESHARPQKNALVSCSKGTWRTELKVCSSKFHYIFIISLYFNGLIVCLNNEVWYCRYCTVQDIRQEHDRQWLSKLECEGECKGTEGSAVNSLTIQISLMNI